MSGLFVSFADCGLPCYVGDVIREEKKLLVATPELFKKRSYRRDKSFPRLEAFQNGLRIAEQIPIMTQRGCVALH